MKLNGVDSVGLDHDYFEIKRNQKKKGPDGDYDALVTVARLKVSALPIGITEEIEKELPPPKPPQAGYLRQKNGKPFTHPDGSPMAAYNRDDPKYKDESKRVSKLQTTAMVYQSLSNDSEITWNATKEKFPDAKDFYTEIWNELKAFGLSMGEMADLVSKVMEISAITKKELEVARESFLSEDL